MQTEAFIEYCAQQLNQLLTAIKQGKTNLKLKHQSAVLLR
jgi:hypothetical protein